MDGCVNNNCSSFEVGALMDMQLLSSSDRLLTIEDVGKQVSKKLTFY